MKTFSLLLFASILFGVFFGLRQRESVAGPGKLDLNDPASAERVLFERVLPPGNEPGDRGPSNAIFPPQSVPLRFDHKKHMSLGQKLECVTCHTKAKESVRSNDLLLPLGSQCDSCHGTNHAAHEKNTLLPVTEVSVVASSKDTTSEAASAPLRASSECATCHTSNDPKNPARARIPDPNLKFSHKSHSDKNIGCAQCHGRVEEIGLATREQLPRMKGCFRCHNGTDNAGKASSECDTCHIAPLHDSDKVILPSVRTESGPVSAGGMRGGKIQTVFESGRLVPPKWMKGADHTPDFLERHKWIAGADSSFCTSCHTDDFCVACHDGRVRPKRTHPSDYLSMHAADARLSDQSCLSCHNPQNFCVTCHQRVGVSQTGPLNQRMSSRFHPPRNVWTDAPKNASHHGYEATRNMTACTSCHIERDCIACHGAKSLGGGLSPHPAGFADSCGRPFRQNPRPCLTCHGAENIATKCRD